MATRMMGLETEYAISALAGPRSTIARRELTQLLMRTAMEKLRHLCGARSAGIFLAHGGRMYIDIEAHPELTTPECTNPWDCARYLLANDRILHDLATAVAKRYLPGVEIVVTKCNVDYSGAQTSWGCHESYLHACTPDALPAFLIPHLVTRVIYTGAGGFDITSPGIRFTLSPRVSVLTAEISHSSEHDRGIYHTKDEPLSARGYHRLHVLCGESLCSHRAMWLKSATTALVVAMADAGIAPGDKVSLASPLAAMRVFAGDPTLQHVAVGAPSGVRTALSIQRQYLDMAERKMNASYMPPWAAAACQHWRAALDTLQDGPAAVAAQFDWAIKYALFKRHVARRNFTMEEIHRWSLIAERAQFDILGPEERLGRGAPTAPAKLPALWKRMKERYGVWLQDRQLNEEGYQRFLALRQELFEIDVRFSQLGPKGIFNVLDAASVLDHAFPGVDNIEHAMEHGPAEGRGGVRAAVIRSHGGKDSPFTCEWDGIMDGESGRWFDLSEPLNPKAEWVEVRRDPQLAIPF